jgi:uncharacterized membrane protein
MTNKINVKECLKVGWTIFKSRPWFFIGVFLLVGLIQTAIGGIQQELPDFIGFLVSLLISTLLYCGIMNLFLVAHDNAQKASFSDLWNPKPFLNYLILSVFLAIIIGIGLVLLIAPGVFAMLVFFLSGYLVIDKGMTPVKALKESMRLTKGSRGNILLLFLAIIGLTIVGMIPFFLGLFVVGPVVILASIHAYKILAGGSNPVEEVIEAV